MPFRPRLGLRADIASGDEDPSNPDLQTFNPLFPKGAYFSEAALIGPANFIDLNPCLDLHLADRLTLIFDWDFSGERAPVTGFTTMPLPLSVPAKRANPYIGSMPQAQMLWDVNRHLSFVAIYGHFFAGSFIKESGSGQDVDYFTTLFTYKF